MRPNLPEQQILKIIEKLKLPYKYVGNFGFWIEGKNPDFVNINGQKKIIECWGVHWHTEKELKQRDFLFRQYGYKTLFIWDYELKDLSLVEQKILEFESG
jgi:very-short-patch-repair endonuclease